MDLFIYIGCIAPPIPIITSKKESQRFSKYEKDLMPALAGWRMKGYVKGMSLWDQKVAPGWQPAEKQEPQPHSPKDPNSASSPRPEADLQVKAQPGQQLSFVLLVSEQRAQSNSPGFLIYRTVR